MHSEAVAPLETLMLSWKKKITVEKRDNTGNWEAVRGFWDGSKKTYGRSGVVL